VLGTWVVVVMEGKEGSKGRRIRVGLLLLKALIRHVLPFAAGKAPAFALEGLALLGGEGQEGSIHLQGRGSRARVAHPVTRDGSRKVGTGQHGSPGVQLVLVAGEGDGLSEGAGVLLQDLGVELATDAVGEGEHLIRLCHPREKTTTKQTKQTSLSQIVLPKIEYLSPLQARDLWNQIL